MTQKTLPTLTLGAAISGTDVFLSRQGVDTEDKKVTGTMLLTFISGNLGLGTAASLNVGTSANNIVQLDGAAKLPAVDGSQLTNLPASGGGAYVSADGGLVTGVTGYYTVMSNSVQANSVILLTFLDTEDSGGGIVAESVYPANRTVGTSFQVYLNTPGGFAWEIRNPAS